VDSARDNRRGVRPRHEVPSQARGHQDARFFRPRVEPHVRCAIKVQSGLIERNPRLLSCSEARRLFFERHAFMLEKMPKRMSH
jgi:hypothetical protein